MEQYLVGALPVPKGRIARCGQKRPARSPLSMQTLTETWIGTGEGTGAGRGGATWGV